MIEKIEDFDFQKEDTPEQFQQKIKDKLGISLDEMKQSLSQYLINNSEKLSEQFSYIVPFGDYSKMLEEDAAKAVFLKEEASKPEHWYFVGLNPIYKDKVLQMMKFAFICTAMDSDNPLMNDEDPLEGFVFVNLSGKIMHSFAQNQE